VDLAKQIRVEISSSSRVSEDQFSAEYHATTNSAVAEKLTESRVVKSCYDGGLYQVIAKIDRQAFIQSVEAAIQQQLKLVQEHAAALKQADNDKTEIRVAVQAKRFLAQKAQNLKDNFILCRALGKCADKELSALLALEASVDRLLGHRTFQFVGSDSLAQELKRELTDLLAEAGYTFSEEAKNAQVQANCRKTVYPRSQALNQQFVGIECQLEGRVQGIEIFSLRASARGAGDNAAGALAFARSRLELTDAED
jgi:hypothetical protein